jgi:uncharacterized protein (DUF302 family)
MEAGTAAMAEAGLITVPSRYSPKDTADRLQADLTGKGATIFARIDHAAGAASVHMTLRPTELLIFGNPRAGTPLMQANQTAGIDLPLKLLVWENGNGRVWVSYNDALWISRRHQLGASSMTAAESMAHALSQLVAAVTTGPPGKT